jgi:predicted MFS family arabinose efflux permease
VPAARRTEGLALFGVSGMLPIALGGLLGDLILRAADYTALFSVACGFAALSLLLSLPLRDLPRGEADQEPSRGFWAALIQRDLQPIWWATFAFALAVAAVFTFLKRYVDETGLASVGGFFSAYCSAAILLRLTLGWLPDRIGPKRVLFPALGAVAVACCLLAAAKDAHQVIVAGTLFGLGHGFAFPVLFGILVTRARPADRGSAMGIFTAFFDVGIAVGGPLIGALIMAAGFGAAFAATAGIVAAGMLVFGILDGRR